MLLYDNTQKVFCICQDLLPGYLPILALTLHQATVYKHHGYIVLLQWELFQMWCGIIVPLHPCLGFDMYVRWMVPSEESVPDGEEQFC